MVVGVAMVGPVMADQTDTHDALVEQLVQQQHVSPLLADCIAHAAYVVPTSPVYDRVEFLPSALDDQHATIEPWGQPFDTRKQRITVDTLVSVNGLGYRKAGGTESQPDLLKFRCGYVADKLLAFGYNEPEAAGSALAAPPAIHARNRRQAAGGARHATHAGGRTAKAGAAGSRHAAPGHSASAQKTKAAKKH